MLVRLAELSSDQGSVVLFNGAELKEEADGSLTETGYEVTIAADHRCAGDIAEGLEIGDDVVVDVEGWQVWGPKRKTVSA